jgi:hypothetical protein
MIAAISQKVMELRGKRVVVKIGLLPMPWR